ncbi:hypothetical protein [Halorubrum aquaticum]|uniref:hypothetical protein n=1 Tax=Halorubrum aquaticum TaxID=387340 RepID=UPI0016600544|nr:hypothetical protein [Halorubrum aquaticum]
MTGRSGRLDRFSPPASRVVRVPRTVPKGYFNIVRGETKRVSELVVARVTT